MPSFSFLLSFHLSSADLINCIIGALTQSMCDDLPAIRSPSASSSSSPLQTFDTGVCSPVPFQSQEYRCPDVFQKSSVLRLSASCSPSTVHIHRLKLHPPRIFPRVHGDATNLSIKFLVESRHHTTPCAPTLPPLPFPQRMLGGRNSSRA